MSKHWTWIGEGTAVLPVTARRMIQDQAVALSRGKTLVTVTLCHGRVVGIDAPRGTAVVVVDWEGEYEEEAGE